MQDNEKKQVGVSRVAVLEQAQVQEAYRHRNHGGLHLYLTFMAVCRSANYFIVLHFYSTFYSHPSRCHLPDAISCSVFPPLHGNQDGLAAKKISEF